jgi:tetraprenyl-beta-curcumene synthase
VPSAIDDRRLAARASIALVVANARYWSGVAATVHLELARWQRRAQSIADPELRALALDKLDGEGFHAQAAAMLATGAPRAQRETVTEAIVALELLFDYLDGLSERPSKDPLGDGELLFATLKDAVSPPEAASGRAPFAQDGGYLQALSDAVRVALLRLPGAPAVTDVARRTASRAGQAQTRMHATGALGAGQLQQWAAREAQGTGLGWRELACGAASSVLALHALIVAAADPATTPAQGERIAAGYLSTCAVLTLLDGLVDEAEDTAGEQPTGPGYLDLYEDPGELGEMMAALARRAITQTRALPDGPQHVMLFVAVVGYYGTERGAASGAARPVIARVRRELRPLIGPTLAVMRAWRAARRLGTVARAHRPSQPARWRTTKRSKLA